VEAGVASGSAITTVLPSVVGATGSLGRIVGWVADSYSDILMDQDDWSFMRSTALFGAGASFTTIFGQARYPLGGTGWLTGGTVEGFGKWATDSIWSFTTATGPSDEINLGEVTFDEWRADYMNGANRNVRSRPQVFAVGPDQSLCLGPNVNALYTVTADYFVAPTDLVLDTDVPVFPARFHMLPVYRTLIKAGQYESAPELVQRGEQENAGMYAQLLAARAPVMSFGGALA
jgi:hypothetical protein